MKRDAKAPVLSAVFVDYDNIYLSLKRRSEEAARRFAKEAATWLRGIETGTLITATNGVLGDVTRRIVLNRCYGNPVPRRNAHDNSTDMSSFPFVRHHFLRAGFEVVDCPPLTAQLKNSSDIRMVMDMRDYLTHDTYFDEFIILSGDADFTPVLHRLRQHARKTVIFANDHTAAPYTAICDGEVREMDLVALLMGVGTGAQSEPAEAQPVPARVAAPAPAPAAGPAPPAPLVRLDDIRTMIVNEVVGSVRSAPAPVALAALADRAVRMLGHDRTIGSGWGGAGTFRELLRQALPPDVRVSNEPPFIAFDASRHLPAPQPVQAAPVAPAAADLRAPDPLVAELSAAVPRPAPQPRREVVAEAPPAAPSPAQRAALAQSMEALVPERAAPIAAPPAPRATPLKPEPPTVQQSITRIYDACKAPPLAPMEYHVLFEIIAREITENGLAGGTTLSAIAGAAQDRGLDIRLDDVRFVMDVISEPDPWFEQGASANLFASRFRNFVVKRCHAEGLTLSAEELDLIDAWFTAGGAAAQKSRVAAEPQRQAPPPAQRAPAPTAAASAPAQPRAPVGTDQRGAGNRWWAGDESRSGAPEAPVAADEGEEFPRIIRSRQRV